MSHSPILFESDDENADCNNDETVDLTINLPVIKRPPGYVKDEACVFNLRTILKGVPPPPNYTTPELDTNEILAKYYDSSKILSIDSEVTPMEVSTDSLLPPPLSEETNSGCVKDEGEFFHKDINSITTEGVRESEISMDLSLPLSPSKETNSALTEGVEKPPQEDASSVTPEGVGESEVSVDLVLSLPPKEETNSTATEEDREPPYEDANSFTSEGVRKSADHVSDQDNNEVNSFISYRDNWKKDVPFMKDYSTIVWPDISHIAHFDIYYNLGSMSEELSSLIDKYRERYIGCETGSSFVMRNPVLTGSAKKRARRRAWGGYSPGRRLSHLAQRRRTFSSENLSQFSTNRNGRAILPGSLNNNKLAVSKKVIMVDMKSKNSQKSKSTSRIKDTNRALSKPNINQSKRALFQSPDQVTKNSGRKDRTSKTTPNKWRTSKRSLWPSSDKKNRRSAKKATPKKTVIEDSDEEVGSEEVINTNGKRLSSSSDSCQARKRCQKSLNFSSEQNMSVNEGKTSGQNLKSVGKQQQLQCNQQLSQHHKQKMLWAVASSLKQCGINNSHELFRPAGTVLFKRSRQVWLHMLSTKKSEVKRSTSEQMFEIALKHAPETIKKLKSVANSRVSLSTENFVNINSVTGEEKSKAGFSKVSDIFFNSVKNSQSSQEDTLPRTAEENENINVKPLAEITDSNSNSLSHQSSEVSFSAVKDEKTSEISNSEYSNSNTDDSMEKNLRRMFDSCATKPVKLGEMSSSPLDLPKILNDDSQISQFNIISNNAVRGNPNLSIDKLSSNSVFNKSIQNEESETVDSSLRDIVEDLKLQIESSLNENDSGFIDNESKPSTSADVKLVKNEIQSPTTFTATVKEFSSSSEEKENLPLKLSDIAVVPISSTENATFRFKKFGSLAENTGPFAEQESNDSNKSSVVVTSVHFDETAMSSCDISVKES